MTHVKRVSVGMGVALAATFAGTMLVAPEASAATFSSSFPSNEAIVINGGEVCTPERNVMLTLSASNAQQVRVSLNDQFDGGDWEIMNGYDRPLMLPEVDATYTVYAQYRSPMHNTGKVISTQITLDQEGNCEEKTPDALFAPIVSLLETRINEESVTLLEGEMLSEEQLMAIISELEAEIRPLLEDDAYLHDIETLFEGFSPEILAYLNGLHEDVVDEDAWMNEGEVNLDEEETVAVDALAEGELVRSQTAPAVYQVGADQTLHVFERDVIFEGYGHDTADVRVLSDAVVSRMHKGDAMPVATGGLIKTPSEVAVYVVEDGPARRHVGTEEIAREAFGSDWASKVIDVTADVLERYKLRAPFTL